MAADAGSPLERSVRTARSLLFVPASRPERFAKARASGADLTVLDLEDAVPQGRKAAARVAVVDQLNNQLDNQPTPGGPPAVVRINSLTTAEARLDVDALAAVAGPIAVMAAKAESAAALTELHRSLPSGSVVIALIETARGVAGAGALAAAPGVARLAFGHLDLCAELGLEPETADLWPIRLQLVLASAAAGLAPPVDGVTTSFRDLDQVAWDTRRAGRSGMPAKLCIHPDQVAVVHRELAPTPKELHWAHEVMRRIDSGAPTQLDGQMIDRPVYLRAAALLARSERQKADQH